MSLRELPIITPPQALEATDFGLREDVIERWQGRRLAGIEASAAERSIDVFEAIGEDMWGYGITAQGIKRALDRMGPGPVALNINSPGGDVFEGIAIYNLLVQHEGEVTVNVIGLSASAASVIQMAGDVINIAKSAFVMIHNVWGVVIGNRNDFEEVSALFAQFDGALAEIYAERTDGAADAIATMMDNETWMSGRDAVARGFADALLSDGAVEADASAAPVIAHEKAAETVNKALTRYRPGMSRSQRRALVKDLGGKPGAAPDEDVTLNADVKQALARLADTFQS